MRRSERGKGALPPGLLGGVVLATFQLRIIRDSGRFDTWARVLYAHPGIGMGVAFFETAPEHKATIAEWIAELSALKTT